MSSSKNRKRKSRAAETLAQWKECNVDTKRSGKIQAIGSKKGCMKGKGGPQNAQCTYRGVRQRTWGKWVVEIRKPNGGKRLWVGTFSNSVEAARAYDEAAMILYGSCARLNFPAGLDSTTTSNYSEIPLRNEDGESIATSSAVEEDRPELLNDDFFKDIEDIGQLGCLDVNDDFFESLGSFFDDGQLGCLDVDQCGAPSGVS